MDDSYLGRSPAMLVLQELRRTFDQEPTFWTGPREPVRQDHPS